MCSKRVATIASISQNYSLNSIYSTDPIPSPLSLLLSIFSSPPSYIIIALCFQSVLEFILISNSFLILLFFNIHINDSSSMIHPQADLRVIINKYFKRKKKLFLRKILVFYPIYYLFYLLP